MSLQCMSNVANVLYIQTCLCKLRIDTASTDLLFLKSQASRKARSGAEGARRYIHVEKPKTMQGGAGSTLSGYRWRNSPEARGHPGSHLAKDIRSGLCARSAQRRAA